jgi:hypothetical protein
MKSLFTIFLFAALPFFLFAQTLKPYTEGFSSDQELSDLKTKVKTALQAQNFEVVGEYMPANDKYRWLIVITHDELLESVKSKGGIRGFAATLRVAITRESDKSIVSYTTPEYWGSAYFQTDYTSVSGHYDKVAAALEQAMNEAGTFSGTMFGSEKGLEMEKLQKYHYMFGMPYYDDVVELGEFATYDDAVKTVDEKIEKGVDDMALVYKVSIPEKELTLYGFGLGGENGESKFLPIIDISNPKHTAFLPYEILVKNNEVIMLHGRYRIALAFPDLTMGTFTKIMSTPGDIEDMMKKMVE